MSVLCRCSLAPRAVQATQWCCGDMNKSTAAPDVPDRSFSRRSAVLHTDSGTVMQTNALDGEDEDEDEDHTK